MLPKKTLAYIPITSPRTRIEQSELEIDPAVRKEVFAKTDEKIPIKIGSLHAPLCSGEVRSLGKYVNGANIENVGKLYVF